VIGTEPAQGGVRDRRRACDSSTHGLGLSRLTQRLGQYAQS
jgi:hypothetical protein